MVLEALPTQGVSSVGGHHPLRRTLPMVSTQQKAVLSTVTGADVATPTQPPHHYAAAQVSGCRGCQRLALLGNGYSSADSRAHCDQVDNLSAQPGGRAVRESRKVKEHQGS